MPNYEQRDVDVPIVLAALAGLALTFVVVLAILYGVFQNTVDGLGGGPGLGVDTAGERPLNERLGAIPAPRLDGLRELQAVPPTVSPSGDAPRGNSPDFHPEDLRPARHEGLQTYGWVDRDKDIARIPIGRAMDVVAAGRTGGTR